MSRYFKLSAKLAAFTVMLSMMACSDEINGPDQTDPIDEDSITMSLIPESAGVSTRGAYSDGSMVSHLYYAIFKKGDNGYEIDEFYHPDKVYKVMEYGAEQHKKKLTIKLIPEPGAENAEYKMVCWAQFVDVKNGKTESDYYDLTDFPTIKVKYKDGNDDFANNDEARDAFYASKEFTGAQRGKVTDVILTRPFAQINVGTSGWDYEGLASIEPDPKVVRYSSITIIGAANTLDILNNKAEKPAETLTVTYKFSKIPAYKNLESFSNPEHTGIYETDNGPDGIYTKKQAEEEFLKLRLDKITPPEGVEERNFDLDGDKFADYINWDTYNKFCVSSADHDALIYNIFTETFKYLSMSYVLVPFEVTKDENGKEKRSGQLVDVEFDCSQYEKSPGVLGDTNVLSLKNVPVCSNNRTNIIAVDGTGFFMNSNEMRVKIYHETFADYYKRLGANDKEWGESDLNGDSGSEVNDEYKWPDEDKEDGKVVTPTRFYFTFTNGDDIEGYFTDTEHPSLTDNVIYTFSWDGNKYLTFNVNGYFDEGTTTGKDLSYAYDMDFYLEGENLDASYFEKKNGMYIMKLPLSKLNDVIKQKGKSIENLASADGLQLGYYTLDFEVKYTSRNPYQYLTPENNTVSTTIRVYPVKAIYTFSNTSTDEGGELMKKFKIEGTLGALCKKADGTLSNDAREDDERNAFYITEKDYIETDHLKILSRKSSSYQNNDKIYALEDHLRLRGASNENGHWLFLKGWDESCKITVKLGRDEGEDNSNNTNDKYYNRKLHMNWGQCDVNYSTNDDLTWKDLVDQWQGYDKGRNDKVRHKDENDTNTKTVFRYNESKIMSKQKPATSSQDIKLYVEQVSHSYYWIIISE